MEVDELIENYLSLQECSSVTARRSACEKSESDDSALVTGLCTIILTLIKGDDGNHVCDGRVAYTLDGHSDCGR